MRRALAGVTSLTGVTFVMLVALLAALPVAALAQSAAPVSLDRSSSTPPPPARETRLYLGMWTTHLKDESVRLDPNWLFAISHGPFFGGTFINSFNRRAYTLGVQKPVFGHGGERARLTLGVRGGAVTGYDERFMKIAGKTPVMPLVSVYSIAEVGRAGVEVSWTMVVVSVAACFRF
jgi:hypothetical protein